MSKAFSVKNLNFSYSEKHVIKDLSCDIEEGAFVCIIGKNGSGKTTFAKLLAGILTPDSGTISKAFDHCAVVFQNPENQFVSNIVEEDVAFGPENLCFPTERIRTSVEQALKRVGMFDQKGRTLSSLSGGEKQRVAIAGALAVSAECLILDEPSSMLSSKGKSSVISFLEKLHNEHKTTIVCVTQNPDLALVADKILIMNDGIVRTEVEPESFVENFEKYQDCGLVLPDHIELMRLLNKNGFNISLENVNAGKMAEDIIKQC